MPAWTDDPATSSTRVRAVHINELRRTVDYYRAQAGLQPVTWADQPITSATLMRAWHFVQLRQAIQDLWNAHGLGALPNWSVGTAPSSTRVVSARDVNDLRAWMNRYDPPIAIWTGFHFCNPLDNITPISPSNLTPNQIAQLLLQNSGRWATEWLCPPSGGLDGGFRDAIDLARSAISQAGGPQLSQCIVRLFNNNLPTFTDYASAESWIQPYIANLDYFTSYGGQNVVIFNELNITGEPQQGIDQRTIALIAAALRDHYAASGTPLLYTLFPRPGGMDLNSSAAWNTYWGTYDLWDGNGSPQKFEVVYGSTVDARLQGHTMLYHGGQGIFDRAALHCYAPDPTTFSSADPNQNPALGIIQWYLNPYVGSTAKVVDSTGWCYVTECGGQCSTLGQPCFGDSASAGAALAAFEANANTLYATGNAAGNPPLLQAVYGYILMYSNDGATTKGQHAIGNTTTNPPSSAYLNAYLAAKTFP